jgi:hypothetical protein
MFSSWRRYVCILGLGFALTGVAQAGVVVQESFSAVGVPANWAIQGMRGGDHYTWSSNVESAIPAATMLPGGYLHLTSDGAYGSVPWQRSSAFYVGATVDTGRDWTLTADIRVNYANGYHGDGLAFCWVDSASVASNSDLLGGYGGYLGAPRGGGDAGQRGYVSGLKGYALEFDQFQNGENNDPAVPYAGLLNLGTWSHASAAQDFSHDPATFLNNGWQTIQLQYDAADKTFTFEWNYDSRTASFLSSTVWAAPQGYQGFNGYFGITAASAVFGSDQDVRNFRIETAVPEPFSLGIIAAGGVILLRRRCRP